MVDTHIKSKLVWAMLIMFHACMLHDFELTFCVEFKIILLQEMLKSSILSITSTMSTMITVIMMITKINMSTAMINMKLEPFSFSFLPTADILTS